MVVDTGASFTSNVETVHNGGIDLGTSGRIDSNVVDAAGAYNFRLQPTTSLTSGYDRWIFRVNDSAGNQVMAANSDGSFAFGNYADTSTAMLMVKGAITQTGNADFRATINSSGTNYGPFATAVVGTNTSVNDGVTGSNITIIGAFNTLYWGGKTHTGGSAWGNVWRIPSQNAGLGSNINPDTVGGWLVATGSSLGKNTGVVTDWFGGRINKAFFSIGASGTGVTNAYGLYLEEQTQGTTINNEMFLAGAGGIWLRDQNLYLESTTDGHLDLYADTSVDVNSTLDMAGNINLNGYYQDISQIAAPASPASGTRRLYVDSSDGKIKVRKSDGTSVDLENGPGSVYGSCYGNEVGWSQAATQDVWYEISDTDVSDGVLLDVTHDGSGKLTVPSDGDYVIAYSLTFEASAANKHIEVSISINGTEQSAGQCHIETATFNLEYVLSNSTILTLTAGQTVEISIRTNDTGTPTLAVDDFNLLASLLTDPGVTSGAPNSADYLVKTANGSLTAERVVTDTSSVSWDWSTAGQAKANVNACAAWPVGSVFIGVVSTSPATLLGCGTWAAIGAGRVLVGLDSGDTDFDVEEETGGSKTVAAAGTNATENSHNHSVTSNVAVGNHSVTQPSDHASHSHQYTDVPNHAHVQNINSGSTGGSVGYGTDDSTTGSKATAISTANNTGGVATGTTAGPSATLSHSGTAVDAHSVTNNAVTSGVGSSHGHNFTGSATSVVQPYLVVKMWKRTA
jgi:hypothetical protein